MEDVLDVYQRPYDPHRPVVCIDETNKQLIKEERLPCKPGSPEKADSVYVRNGGKCLHDLGTSGGEKRHRCDKDLNGCGFCKYLKIYCR